MVREPAIPLFLWIATALLIHIGGYKGSDEIVTVVEERHSLYQLTQVVIDEIGHGPSELEVALLDDDELDDDADPDEPDEDPDEDPDADPDEDPDDNDDDEPDPDEPDEPEPDPFPAPTPEPPLPDDEPDELATPPAEEKVEPAPKVAQLELPKLDRRIAVVQHVEDKNQEDNPDAEFIGDEANRVDKQTQAQITSTEEMDPNPTPGGNHVGPVPEPGNADETRVAQSEDEPGDPDVVPTPEPEPPNPVVPPPPPAAVAHAAPPPRPRDTLLPAQKGLEEREAVEAQAAVETLSSNAGSWDAPRGQEAREAIAAQHAQKKRLPPLRTRFSEIFGFGSQATTENGVNLNLSPSAAVAAVGQEQLAQERRRDGERRKSEHRGSWRTLGIERWRASIENYVASVQPGNQTALNTARVPFASYLNHVHNRIHPVFAVRFLSSLDRLPKSSPLNDFSMSTHMEIVLHQDDGRLVRMGITKTSGVTAFDIGALEAISAAAPFGRPPPSIVSPDGNVYLHWEFHRDPRYACSTYFARPYIIKAKPQTAPPRIKPPRELPSPNEQHGSLVPGNALPPELNRRKLPALVSLGHQRSSHHH